VTGQGNRHEGLKQHTTTKTTTKQQPNNNQNTTKQKDNKHQAYHYFDKTNPYPHGAGEFDKPTLSDDHQYHQKGRV